MLKFVEISVSYLSKGLPVSIFSIREKAVRTQKPPQADIRRLFGTCRSMQTLFPVMYIFVFFRELCMLHYMCINNVRGCPHAVSHFEDLSPMF